MSTGSDSLLAQLATGRAIDVLAEGGSMYPVIRHGDVVHVTPLAGAPALGDIVLAVIDGVWVMHRIVRLCSDGTYWTRGDFRRRPDAPVRRAAIVGRAVRVRRGARELELVWSDPLTRAWLHASRAVALVGRLALAARSRLRR